MNRFKIVHREELKFRFPGATLETCNDIIIFEDTITGVLYLSDRYGVCYTVMLDPEGKPLTMNYKNEKENDNEQTKKRIEES